MKQNIAYGILIMLLILAGCAGRSGSNASNGLDTVDSQEQYCPTLYVPPTVVPVEYEPSGYSSSTSFEYYLEDEVLDSEIEWDGWQWSSFSSGLHNIYCNSGDAEGENVNYLYCKSRLFEVEKSFTDENGEVVEHRMYYITLIYEPTVDSFALREIQYHMNMFSQEPDCVVKP